MGGGSGIRLELGRRDDVTDNMCSHVISRIFCIYCSCNLSHLEMK